MARVTLSLPDEVHRALKEAAVRRGKTLGELVSESLAFYGIKSPEEVSMLITKARERSGLSEAEAVALADRETRAVRGLS